MRARSLKPSLFTNEYLAVSDPLDTVIFAGLWCLADREGKLEDRPAKIHISINPGRAIEGTVKSLCWLAEMGFIQRYEIGGVKYILISAFTKHQNPHVKEKASEIPNPSGACTIQAPGKHGAKNNLGDGQHALTPDSGLLTPDSRSSLPPSPNPDTSGFLVRADREPLKGVLQSLEAKKRMPF